MKCKLVTINSNNLFDKDYKNIVIYKTEIDKKVALDKLFKDGKEFDIFSNISTDDGLLITIAGNQRLYNYALIRDKYYFIINVRTFYEDNKEKTRLTLRYDLINNSNLLEKDLLANATNNNLLLYRTNIPNIKPTYNNLIKCSNICQNITNDIKIPKRNLYQLSNFYRKITPPPPVHPDIENLGVPVLYINFKGSFVNVSGGDSSARWLFNNLLYKINDNIELSDVTRLTDQFITYSNYEYNNFIVVALTDDSIVTLENFISVIWQIDNIDKCIDSFSIDYIDKSLVQSTPESNFVAIDYRYITTKEVVGLAFKILNNQKYDTFHRYLAVMPDNSKVLKTYNDIKYDYTHFNYAHILPYFFSQRWPIKKYITPYYDTYQITQTIGENNTFANVFGSNSKDENLREYFDNDKISNMQSATINVGTDINYSARAWAQARDGGSTAITSAIGLIAGAKASAEGSTVLGLAAGTIFGGAARGIISTLFPPASQGVAHLAPNDNYKKFGTYQKDDEIIAPPRYSIDIYETYLTENQKQVINNDRLRYGDYINEYINNLDVSTLNDTYYFEGHWNLFNIGIHDVNFQQKFIEICNRGVFITFSNKETRFNITSTNGTMNWKKEIKHDRNKK